MKREMVVLGYIQKTRDYLDYLERHILNVKRAWEEIQEKCKDMDFIWDDWKWACINEEVINHDTSKMSQYEFTQYRANFYPTESEKKNQDVKKDFAIAWEHHKEHNIHHWENWTQEKDNTVRYFCLVGMVVDWLAMSYEFGDTPRKYYERSKNRITGMTEIEIEILNEIFDKLEN